MGAKRQAVGQIDRTLPQCVHQIIRAHRLNDYVSHSSFAYFIVHASPFKTVQIQDTSCKALCIDMSKIMTL